MVSPGFEIRVAVAVSALASISPASAHHSRAAFDITVVFSIEGVVKNVLWANPHVYMTLEVAGPNGQPVTQEVEVGPLASLRPLGSNPRTRLLRATA